MGSIQMVSAMRKCIQSTTKNWMQFHIASALKFTFILVMVLSVHVGRGQNFAASYPFTNVTTISGTTDPTPVPTATGAVFSSFTSSVGTNPNAASRFSFTGWPTGAANGSDVFTGSLSTTSYYQVSVTISAGYSVSLSSITFTIQRSGTGIRQYSVRANADSYTANLPASISPVNATLSIAPTNIFQITDITTSAQTGNTITLSGVNFTNLAAGTTRTFRFYGWNSEASGGTFSIDDVVISGIATSVSSATLDPVTLSSPLSTTYGTASTGVSFTASGTNLTGDITATAQTGYQVSTDDINYSGSVSVASGLPVYVRFAATQNAGNYNGSTAVILSSTGATNVNVTTSATGNTVSPKALSITAPTITSKVYDATTTAGAVTVGSLSGFVGTQTVTATATAAAYSSANVGTYNNVAVTYTLANGTNGGLAANYSLAAGSATGVITARALTITANDVTKAPGVLLTDGVVSSGFTSSGLAGAETIGTVTITYGSAGAATGDGNTIGSYPNQVTPSNATGGTFNTANYALTYAAGTINVSLNSIGDYQTRSSGDWNNSTTWEKWDGGNWVNCTGTDFPDNGTANVTIRSGHNIDNDGGGAGTNPLPTGTPWDVRNLTVEAGAVLKDYSFVGGNSYIQIYGNIVCNGTIGDPLGDDISFDIAGGANCTISGTGSFTATRVRKDQNINPGLNTTLTIDMDVRLTWSQASGVVLFNDAGATSNFNVTVNAGKTIRCFGPGSIACNVSIDGTNGNEVLDLGGVYTIFGTMDIDGTFVSLNNNVSRSTSVIVKNNGILKCRYIQTGGSGAAGNTITVESGGRLNIFGSVDTVAATLNQTTWNNFSTTNNTWDFQPGSTIEYSGNTRQTINGITQCSNFTVSGGSIKTLGNNFRVDGILTLTNGLLTTSSVNLLTLSSTATCPAGGSFSSFVNGPMRKEGDADFRFPVGKSAVNRLNISGTGNVMNGGYRPISISGLTASANFLAEYQLANPYLQGPISPAATAAGLQAISRCEYWDLVRENGTQTPTVTLTWSDNAVSGQSQCNVGPYIISPASTYVVPYYNSMWGDQNTTFYGRSGSITTPSSPLFLGEISWDGAGVIIDSYLKFVIGTNNWQQAPLPFDIKHFKAEGKEKNIQLDWLVNHNDEVRSYVIERSRDGIHFENMKMVAARANEDLAAYADVDPAPYNGWGYYRLRITDFAGKIGYSNIQKVWMGNTGTYVQVTPKPAKDRLWINLAEPEKISEMVIVNSVGQLLFKQNRFTNNNQIDISSFRPGVYYVRIVGQNGIITEPFVKE